MFSLTRCMRISFFFAEITLNFLLSIFINLGVILMRPMRTFLMRLKNFCNKLKKEKFKHSNFFELRLLFKTLTICKFLKCPKFWVPDIFKKCPDICPDIYLRTCQRHMSVWTLVHNRKYFSTFSRVEPKIC